ncbi:hypothetical protein [Arthrobacter sp. Cr_A7]|uniref:biotin synthase auxiliary protein BsaP n=1 Tax=Arthrobacter sp. Cr_A7 TaxID=3031017 RepID=UPI0023DC0053|nr:hypothetical protein [Arthrobacter sp. Cr_A7]
MSTAPQALDPEAQHCGLCGGILNRQAYDGVGAPPSDLHLECAARLHLEPPRFCVCCGRRLKVQVSPSGWWAQCSRHGATTS